MTSTRLVQIRRATPGDWSVISGLLEANGLPLAGVHEHLDTFWLAVAPEGQAKGVAGLEVYGEAGLLRSVAVQPEHQGTGVGTALLGEVLREAKRLRLRSLHLLTMGAANYFERFGFELGPIREAPEGLEASAEFQGACPASAMFMTVSVESMLQPQSPAPSGD